MEKNEITLKGWVARDKDTNLYLFDFDDKPYKKREVWVNDDYYRNDESIWLPPNKFPEVKWEDEEPTPATITIKIDK